MKRPARSGRFVPRPREEGAPWRILWLLKGLGPGGAERLLVSTAAVRDRDRFDYAALYLLPWKTALVPELEALGVAVDCLGCRREADVRWAIRLRRHLRRHQPDILHVHSPYAAAMARIVVRTLPRRLRPVVITTEHSLWDRHAVLTRWAGRLTSAWDARRIAVSEGVRSSLPADLHGSTEVITHGVDVAAVRAQRQQRDEVRAELGIGPDEIVVGTIANYRALKAYPDLLAAAVEATGRHPGLRFVAVGQGPLEAEVHRLHAELGLGDRFLLLGYRADAVRMLAGCDVFVLASLVEGLPVALMEALALGLPVVATRVGGIPEAVGPEEAELVPPSDPAALAEALVTLASDPTRRERMATAAAVRSSAFDIRGAAARIEEIYVEELTQR
jgi:glycosyltransferase involved in cell wall biosynthesis